MGSAAASLTGGGAGRAATKLLFVTSEMGDFIKSGGLGEVASALPRALRKLFDVRVLLPGFKQVRDGAQAVDVVCRMAGSAGLPPWSLGRTRTQDGLVVYVVLCDELYAREGSPYGPFSGGDFEDNDVRFARLSLAAAELAAGEADANWRPDVLHVNDWTSALAPAYLRWKNIDTPSILTIHNLAYQGLYAPERMSALGIPDQAFALDGAEFHGKISFLKAGISYASHVTTVSETYAREITTQALGCGLDGLLRTRLDEGRLTGIINGIDEEWDRPSEQDASIDAWKARQADVIRAAFDLPASDGPLFSIVSRLVHQKGIDLSVEAAETIVANGGQLVIIGRGDAPCERDIEELVQRHPESVSAHIGFDEAQAQQMFAASDFLLMPSRFEPCGLSQMYAQRAGSLPIARRTGGLADTIEDGKSGFLFSSPTAKGLSRAVARAIRKYRTKRAFGSMRRAAMAKEFGWEGPRSCLRLTLRARACLGLVHATASNFQRCNLHLCVLATSCNKPAVRRCHKLGSRIVE